MLDDEKEGKATTALERFSIECDWLQNVALHSQPITGESKQGASHVTCSLVLSRAFPRFSAGYIYDWLTAVSACFVIG